MGYLKVFAVVVLCVVFVLPTYAEPNNITIVPVQATQPTAEQKTACAKPASQNLPTLPSVTDEAIRIARAEMERDAYKQAVEASQKSVEHTKWIFTSMLTVFGFIMVIFGVVIYKETGKHREAVVEAREAAKNAREYERQAENSLAEVHKQAKIELDKIKDEGKKQIKDLLDEAEKERKVSELWNDALRLHNESKYKEACNKYAQIVKIKRKDSGAHNNWGVALASLAELTNDEVLFNDACSKYAKAIDIKADNYGVYCNWGNALLELAKFKDDEALFREACSKYAKAIEMKADFYEAYCNWGIALTELAKFKDDEALFKEACSKYAKAIEIKADDYEAYDGWGAALAELAKLKDDEALFKEACSKFAKAIDIKADYYNAYDNWGSALYEWAKLKIGTPEYEDMLKHAEEKCLKAETLKKGAGSYNLACIYALRGDKEKCREWLNVGQENGTLPTREHAKKDSDLASVQEEEWFKAIKWKGEK